MQKTTAVSAGSHFEKNGASGTAIGESAEKINSVEPDLASTTIQANNNQEIAEDLAAKDENLENEAKQNENLVAEEPEAPKPQDTIYHKFANLLSPIPPLKKAFEAYAENKEMANGTKIQSFISKLANQVSIGANLLGLALPHNKFIEFAGKYAYRGMVGIAALGKFSKVSKYNDLIASGAGLFKVLSAFNVFHLLTMPLKAVGVKVPNLNISFNNVYSFFGAANGPMNISSSANKRKMGSEGYANPGESIKAFTEQFKDTFDAISKHGMRAFDPRNSTGVNGTVGGVLQMIGFATKQSGLIMRESGNNLGEALITAGNVLRDNFACVATDCERFSQDNMERGRIQSVASGGNYTTEGVLDVLLNLPFMKPFERQTESLMGLFGTWAAAANTAAVKEENAEFKSNDTLSAKNLPEFFLSVGKAMLKANAGHCLPESIANRISRPQTDAANAVVSFNRENPLEEPKPEMPIVSEAELAPVA
ncbi:MAG: hypothetical protein HRT47_07555 [Candidatus Caenarcaniphilales bacterium]|nr:hypothetical protein [Candidatus Caenarcaniphilales bacterium]